MRSFFLISLFLIFFLIQNISANDTGGVTMSDSSFKTYSTSQGGWCGCATPDMTEFYFDAGDYNAVDSIIYTATDWTFSKEANSVSFTIISGGNGTGIMSYEKSTKKVSWYFSNAVITASIFTLTYSNQSVLNEIGNTSSLAGNEAVGLNYPAILKMELVIMEKAVIR